MLGIMQGRLAPPEGPLSHYFPRLGWEVEYSRAKEAGLDCIEWIYDMYGDDVNPICTAAGLDRMRARERDRDPSRVAVR